MLVDHETTVWHYAGDVMVRRLKHGRYSVFVAGNMRVAVFDYQCDALHYAKRLSNREQTADVES